MDVVGMLEKMGASEKITSKLQSSGVGNIALAYVLYKLATPARYTVTLAGTNGVIRYLRAKGKMQPMQDKNRLRHLAREGRSNLKSESKKLRHRVVTSGKKGRTYMKTRGEKLRGNLRGNLHKLRNERTFVKRRDQLKSFWNKLRKHRAQFSSRIRRFTKKKDD